MKKIKLTLTSQLIILTTVSFIIMSISLIIILPKSLEPFFEQTVYGYLEKPLEIFDINQNGDQKLDNIAYIQYNDDNKIYISSNYKQVLKIKNYKKILEYIDTEKHHSRGKFEYNKRSYYYFVSNNRYGIKIAITSDSYISELRNDLLMIIIPLIVITFLFILIFILIWSDSLVRKIGKLKLKINNITDPKYNVPENKFEFDDELKLLDITVDEMKKMILESEKYRTEMYQNISHDFKTPITVIKSHIEAYHDKIIDSNEFLKISEEQCEKLEKKVKTLLQLNKITYLQNSYKNDKTIDVLKVVKDSIKKYKIINKNINYKIVSDKKIYIFNGTEDIWESIIDNLLSNAIRYAKENIIITLKNDKIVLFNDGENIDKTIIKEIFSRYKKGKKGENGLGLSIVKGNLDLLEYKIDVKNTKKGVEFIISK